MVRIHMDKISGFSLSRVISIFFNNVIVISFVYFLHSSAIKKKEKQWKKRKKEYIWEPVQQRGEREIET